MSANCGMICAFEQARSGGSAWYAMELTELLRHVARTLHVD
jgi:hypothetical protein